MTNMTFAVDAEILRDARKIAIDEDTSVSALLREYLAELVESRNRRRSRIADELFKTWDEHPWHMGDKNWTREDLRGLSCFRIVPLTGPLVNSRNSRTTAAARARTGGRWRGRCCGR